MRVKVRSCIKSLSRAGASAVRPSFRDQIFLCHLIQHAAELSVVIHPVRRHNRAVKARTRRDNRVLRKAFDPI